MIKVERVPWRTRLIVWPGDPFRTLPFPYLFERWQAVEYEWADTPDLRQEGPAFFLRSNAERAAKEWAELG